MPATYTLINSNVLTSTAASITFSAIPSTYTDLVVKISARTSYAGTQSWINLRMNNLSTSIYSSTRLYGTGSAAASGVNSGNTATLLHYIDADTSTSNTFSSTEYYIPSYTANQNKPMSNFSVQENNNATAFMNISANLLGSTAAINELYFAPQDGSFMSGSSFYLYGISNA